MDAATWDNINKLRAWLDSEASLPPGTDPRIMRVLKIGEEFGEVVEAVHGALGANPRKGQSENGWDDVREELCDTAVTTLLALATVTAEPGKALDERLRFLVERNTQSVNAAATKVS
ncbi:MazG-like family protein [Streptomyces sp. NPDC053560]|uniref:MazG-like family protein n=1 Tax=Streptomyces sp. NPDC053560 TaxID=3365711 RepID=UPI0037D7D033